MKLTRESFGWWLSPGTGNLCLVHVSLVPVLNVVGEQVDNFSWNEAVMMWHHLILYVYIIFIFFLLCPFQKTKPTQHSVRGLRGLGLIPDILACRSTKVCFCLRCVSILTHNLVSIWVWFKSIKSFFFIQALEENVKEKLSQFCHVPVKDAFLVVMLSTFKFKSRLFITSLCFLFQLESIFTLYDVPNIWHIPLLLKVPSSQLNVILSHIIMKKMLSVCILSWTGSEGSLGNLESAQSCWVCILVFFFFLFFVYLLFGWFDLRLK